uniref:Uncharacterized protein n=1 Tax=viral metagenome TaxID=1070528 RepID=A0A6C0DNN9_9ZZZZ
MGLTRFRIDNAKCKDAFSTQNGVNEKRYKKLNSFCAYSHMKTTSNIMSVSPVDSSNIQLASMSANSIRRKPLSISSNYNLEDIIMTTCTTLLPSQLEVDQTYLLYSNVTELGLSTRGEKMKLERIEYIRHTTQRPSTTITDIFSFRRTSSASNVDYCVFVDNQGNRFLFTGRQLEKQINIYLA